MSRNSIISIAAGVMLALAGSAQAASPQTTSFAVTAKVASNCIINSAGDMAFGDYDGSAQIDKTSTIAVRCSKNAPYTVALDGGTTNGFAPRKLSFGAERLEYDLYSDSNRTSVWGNTVGVGDNRVIGTGTGLNNVIQHTVYGRIFNNAANQSAAVGNYTDTINVTVAY